MVSASEYNKSYFLALDFNQNRSYFAFYSEFNRHSAHIRWVEVFFLSVLTIWSLAGNSLLITVVLRTKPLRTVMNFFIINLAISHICFTTASPLIAVARAKETWILGTFTCSLLPYSQTLCGVVSMWMMTLVSIDRYRYICGTGRNNITTKSAKLMTFLTWVIAAAAFIPLALFFHTKTFPYGTKIVTICTMLWPTKKINMSSVFVLIICILGFLVPIVVITLNYVRILKKLSSKKQEADSRRLSSVESAQAQNATEDKSLAERNEDTEEMRDLKDYRVVRMMLMVVITFCAMWLPLCIIFLIVLFDSYSGRMAVRSSNFILAICLAFANSCLNPVIYFLFNDKFRNGLIITWNSFGKPKDDGVEFHSVPANPKPANTPGNGRIEEENCNNIEVAETSDTTQIVEEKESKANIKENSGEEDSKI